jgi:uncharacterized protein (DUF58 family)
MTSTVAPAPTPPATAPSPPEEKRDRTSTPSRPIPTAKLYLLLLLGMLIPLITAWIPRVGLIAGWGLMAVYDLLVLVIALIDFQRSKGWKLDIRRECESRLSIGRDNVIRLQLRVNSHTAGQRTLQLKLQEYYPQEFRIDRPTLQAMLQPDTETELTYNVFPSRRGQFAWEGLDLRQLSPLGLVWRAWYEPVITSVEVYPDLIGLRSLSVRLSLESSGSLRRRRHALGGTEFSELREYNLGDDLRLVDWKATARRGHPLVRLMEPERDQPLIILLDRGRLMTAQVAGIKRFDWGLNAALALALAGLRRGDRVGFCVFDSEIHTWIGPQPGQSHLSRIIERVYNLEPVLSESDYTGAVSTLLSQYTRRALVVLLTDLVDATASTELLAAMGRLSPRFLPFCVALRDPQVDVQAYRPLALPAGKAEEQVQTLYEQSVALDLIQQRTLAFARLKQKGVLVLDAPANQISELLVDRYLLLKARGRL